jgi:hypothetical protein
MKLGPWVAARKNDLARFIRGFAQLGGDGFAARFVQPAKKRGSGKKSGRVCFQSHYRHHSHEVAALFMPCFVARRNASRSC